MADGLFTLAASFLIFFSLCYCIEIDLEELTNVELASRLENFAGQESPFCVVYKASSGITGLEEMIVKFLKGVDEMSSYKRWNYATIDTRKYIIPATAHPGFTPSLSCYIGESSPLQYKEFQPSLKSIRRWFKKVSKAFKKRIVPVTFENLNAVIGESFGTIIVGVPGDHRFHLYLENLFKEVLRIRWKEPVSVVMILPSTKDKRTAYQSFGISEFPAIIFIDKQEWEESQKPAHTLQGQLNTGADLVKLEITVRQSQATILNLVNFESEVLETSFPMTPVAVTFYSHRNPRSLDYLQILEKTIGSFAMLDSSFRFGVVNLADSSEVVLRYVNASLASAVPFTVVFWQNKEQNDSKYSIKQALFNQGIPSIHSLYEFLQSNNVPLLIDDDKDTTWLQQKALCGKTAPHDNECVAHDNSTDFVQQDNILNTPQTFGPEVPQSVLKPLLVKSSSTYSAVKIPFVTDKTWAAKIEHSIEPTHKPYGRTQNSQKASLYHVSLVVFFVSGCGYCTKVMPALHDIENSLKTIGISMYLMNCSSAPGHCGQLGITGYPTLIAFRSLSWSVVEQCFPPDLKSRYIRMDYHGVIVPSLVLDWLSNINQPAVNKTYLDEHLPERLDEDVFLVATVYTRSLARRYLSPRLVGRWYPYQCLTLVCELLSGLVPCYALYTRDVVDHVSGGKRNDEDFIISKLILQRRDGVRATIFELGYNLAFTFNQESDSRLHMFHNPHRYDVAKDFKCEDDHRMCTGYTVRFVDDHRRLPVTQVTTAIFHTKTGSLEKDTSDGFTHDLPVMLVLAHSNNISHDNHFYKELTIAAYSLYQDLVFATLNVDDFPHWAGDFVPENYHARAHEAGRPGTLYHYPRLCIVRWKDHQHAAFYPTVIEMERLGTGVQERLDAIDSQQIIKFARDYLKDPKKLIVLTEMF